MFIKAKRPDDGEILEVSEKLFIASLESRGWVLADKPEKAEQEKPVKKVK